MSHFNVQVNIQQVLDDLPSGPTTRRVGHQDPITESGRRQVIEVASIKLTAETEADAYVKAHRMLSAVSPEFPSVAALKSRIDELQEALEFERAKNRPAEPHLHRASCDDPSGNRVCGFPLGPSILSRPAQPRLHPADIGG